MASAFSEGANAGSAGRGVTSLGLHFLGRFAGGSGRGVCLTRIVTTLHITLVLALRRCDAVGAISSHGLGTITSWVTSVRICMSCEAVESGLFAPKYDMCGGEDSEGSGSENIS